MISRVAFDGSSDAYLTLLNVPKRAGAVKGISIAVAYATFGGVQILQPFFVAHRAAAKRCLVGIDWYRSDPAALDALALLPNSQVRIYDGERVLARRGQPTKTYHPKAYVVEATKMCGVILGSGNLSTSGLTTGIEVGEATWAKRPDGDPTLLWTMFGQTLAWFDRMWKVAPPYARIAEPYREALSPQTAYKPQTTRT
jgi:HKD family nuclease